MSPARIEIIPEQYPGAGLLMDLGATVPAPVPNTGIAKYNTVQRPRRRDLNEFQSEEPLKISFSVIMDAWATDGDLHDPYYRIYGWGNRNSLPVGPTVLRTKGPIPFSNLRWILTGIEQVEARQRPSDYSLSYFELKLELTEWNDIDLIAQGLPAPTPAESPAKTALQKFQDRYPTNVTDDSKIRIIFGEDPLPRSTSSGNAPKQRTYTVKGGDTLTKIAARELGNAQRWKEIASLNSIRDPNRISIGQVLKMPS